jgi:hypothetical protein
MKVTCALTALVALAGCGGATPLDITKPVGMEGGAVGVGGASVQIPQGALSSTAMITVTRVDAPAPAGTVEVGPAFDYGPSGQQFSTPVTITLPFDAAKIPSGRTANDILIYTAPKGSTEYTVLAATLTGSTVTTQTTHFTVYLPAVPLTESSQPDMASSGCSPNCSATGAGCSCATTCNGHTYSMTCTNQTSSSSPFVECECLMDGVRSPVSQSIEAPSCLPSDIDSVFGLQCVYTTR